MSQNEVINTLNYKCLLCYIYDKYYEGGDKMIILVSLFLLFSLFVASASLVFIFIGIFSSSMRALWPKLFITLGISLVISIVCLIIPTTNDSTITNDTDNTNYTEVVNTPLPDDTANQATSVNYNLSGIENCVKSNLGENESIKNIVLENDNLCIYIDLSNVDPFPISLEDLAITRTSSITDAILSKNEYDVLWNTITVDYGEIGYIKNSKENIMDNGYGRYFPAEQFILNNNVSTTNNDTLEENTNTENKSFPINCESVCRALTERFIKNVVLEEYSMLAFNVEDFKLDENGNGTIKILYMPSDLTKVNLTIIKNGNVYTIESALLSGLYEVDMNAVPEENKVFIES